MGDLQRREFHAALLDAGRFGDLPGTWQAAVLKAERKRAKLPPTFKQRLSIAEGPTESLARDVRTVWARVPYPNDLAAAATRAGGHRVRPHGHGAPGDPPARL